MTDTTTEQQPRRRGPLRNRVRRAWRVLRGRPLVYGVIINRDGTFKAFSHAPQDRVRVEGCLIYVADPDLPEGLADLDHSLKARLAAERMLNRGSVSVVAGQTSDDVGE